MLFINSWGMVDSEWWRAWINQMDKVGLLNIYSESFKGFDNFANLLDPIKLFGTVVTFANISVPNFIPNDYHRTIFPIAQPPFFLADLAFARFMKNNFDFSSDYSALNVTNIVWTVFFTMTLGLLIKRLNNKHYINWALLLGWANPLLILHANIQGYRDMLTILLITVSITLIISKQQFDLLAGITFGAACLCKPTTIYVFPIMLMVMERKRLLRFISGIASIAGLLLLTFFATGKLYGLLAALLTEMSFAKSLSEGISAWNPFFILAQHSDSLPLEGNLKSLISRFLLELHSHIGVLSIIHLLIFMGIAFKVRFKNLIPFNHLIIQIYLITFYITMPNTRMNHYLVFLPFWLIGIVHKPNRLFNLIIVSVFLLQDFIYAGFGRNSIFTGSSFYSLCNLVLTVVLSIYIYFFWKDRRLKHLLVSDSAKSNRH